MTTDTATLRVVIHEGPGARPLDPALRTALLFALLEKGYSVLSNRHAAHIESDPDTHTLILGSGLQSSSPGPDGLSHSTDIVGLSIPQVLELVDAARQQQSLSAPGQWKPWFPVIDYKRCTNCMQCLSFCLFDVYGVGAGGKIQVQNENNCKTDCPACSRVCPEVAILFPKYRHSPIHGGEVNEDDLRREAMKVDISALLGGDIYSMLRDRSAKAKSRFSKERDEERALKERMTCLNKLQKDIEIPPEVLAALPSVDEIRARAEAAKARADAALAANQEASS